MEKTEFILAKKGKEVAEKIVGPGLTIDYDNGVVNITGSKSSRTILDTDIISALPVDIFGIRINELERQQVNNLMQTDEQKDLATKKRAIYDKLIATCKEAQGVAIEELNQLFNPKS